MNEKFTPGPWNKKEINICSQHKAGLSLAFLTTSDWRKQEEGEANAHLIAAAPELYALLERVKDELVYHLSFSENAKLAVKAESFGAEIFSLLKKARGES